jgi:hypothetical protein
MPVLNTELAPLDEKGRVDWIFGDHRLRDQHRRVFADYAMGGSRAADGADDSHHRADERQPVATKRSARAADGRLLVRNSTAVQSVRVFYAVGQADGSSLHVIVQRLLPMRHIPTISC